jgi:hypothetical protein
MLHFLLGPGTIGLYFFSKFEPENGSFVSLLLPLFLPSCAPACLLGFVLCGDIDGLFASLRHEVSK